MKNRNLDPDDNWITPDYIYDPLFEKYHFDFDPCPYNTGQITPDKDGLLIDLGFMNFVNPPYTRKLKEAFVKRAIMMKQHYNKASLLLLPVSTSTSLFHDFIKPNAHHINFLRGRIKFQKKDAGGNLYTPKNGGMHDSMLVMI